MQSDSLKICVNMAPQLLKEESELEVFVFLEKVSINDLANPSHVFNRLIEYPLLKDASSGNRDSNDRMKQDFINRLMNVNRETNFVYDKKKKLNFSDFNDFFAVNEYLANKNQFSIRYFSHTRNRTGTDLPENATQNILSLQSCFVKIQSIRIVGKFELIERTL